MQDFMLKAIVRARQVVTSVAAKRVGATVPALAGMGLVSAGAALIFLPAGFIAAGVLCLLVDARL